MSARPSVFGLPPGVDFADAFVNGLPLWLEDDRPEALARTTVFVNTQRAARRLKDLFAKRGNLLAPRIRVITDIASDLTIDMAPGPVETTAARTLRALQLVRALIDRYPELAPPADAFDLAQSLTAVFADIEASGQDLTCLERIVEDDLAIHWLASRRFLEALGDLWPEHPGEMAMGSDIRQHAAVLALERSWTTDPPQDPVLVIGSTGSRTTTAAFMHLVARLPKGAIVLPGFDVHLNARSIDALTPKDDDPGSPDHPQSVLVALVNRLEQGWKDVAPWPGAPSGHDARSPLVSLALRPAPITDEWRKQGETLVPSPDAALEGLALMEAPNDRVEAAAISIVLRNALETGKTSALITTDATLSRRVSANLNRWGIVPDESAGRPLTLAPAGTLLSFILGAAATPIPTTDILTLLKHPLVAMAGPRGPYLHKLQNFERKTLRHAGPGIDAALLQQRAPEGWADWLSHALDPLRDLLHEALLADRISAHIAAADRLALGPDAEADAETPLWKDKADPAVRAVLDMLADAGNLTGTTVSMAEYQTILVSALAGEQYREEAFRPHPGIAIWGTLEARTQSADVLVLGGLNEGTWPKAPTVDPWLNRPMRRKAGLPVPDLFIGLSAHDFQQAVCHAEVTLSRSLRQGDAPAVPSRWLTRIENFLGGIAGGQQAWAEAKSRGAITIGQAEALERSDVPVSPATRPSPAPPVAARPTAISASRVETLVRDPFAIYARDVLGLSPLPETGRLPDARDRGTALHKALETFTRELSGLLPDDAQARFEEITASVIASEVPWAAQAQLWSARLARGARDFVRTEKLRRQIAQPVFQEREARLLIDTLPVPVTLTAKADRIDISPDGLVAIYDYKSSAPTKPQQWRYALQLPLEARMVQAGVYDGVPRTSTLHLEIINLFKPSDRSIYEQSPAEIDAIWDGFVALLRTYQDVNAGYTSQYRPRPGQFGDTGDYDHLARRGEWDDTTDFELVLVGSHEP